MRVVVGVGGGIAAYKVIFVVRQLREMGHHVKVVPTAAALRFVGAPTWEAISGNTVSSSVFDDVDQVAHVAIGREADLVIVAPATADLMARAVAGMADDLLTATLLTATAPVLMAPAMHTEMWHHPATQANVATLKSRGVHVLEPAVGRLTGADTGVGRLPEPEDIVAAALALIQPSGDLSGRRVVVSAGGTREALDPVRFIGNKSTGRQGIALAKTARDRGAHVTLVAANIVADVPGVDVVPVESSAQLRAAVRAAAAHADAVVMAAAVADFRPAVVPTTKIKKAAGCTPEPIALVENPDVLAELAHDRLAPGQVVVGFAAETGDESGSVLELGRAKARRKGADLMAINQVGDGVGFGTETNDVTIVDGSGKVVGATSGTKSEVAQAIWDAIAKLW